MKRSTTMALPRRYALYRTESARQITYSDLIEQEIGLELFFMMTAMLALLGPIAVGRVRCIRIAPRLRGLVVRILPSASHRASGAIANHGMAGMRSFDRQRSARYFGGLLRLSASCLFKIRARIVASMRLRYQMIYTAAQHTI